MTTLYYKKTCDTCRKSRSFLRALDPELVEREYSKEPLSMEELRLLLERAGSVRALLNVYNKRVRAEGWKDNPPSEDHFLGEALADQNLIRRPVVLFDEAITIGRDEATWTRLLGS